MALNPESPNRIFHTTKYSCKLEYKLCAKNILSRAIALFQKFNQCDPQRIVIYHDQTGSSCFFNSVESLSMENIIESLSSPPPPRSISFLSYVTFQQKFRNTYRNRTLSYINGRYLEL